MEPPQDNDDVLTPDPHAPVRCRGHLVSDGLWVVLLLAGMAWMLWHGHQFVSRKEWERVHEDEHRAWQEVNARLSAIQDRATSIQAHLRRRRTHLWWEPKGVRP